MSNAFFHLVLSIETNNVMAINNLGYDGISMSNGYYYYHRICRKIGISYHEWYTYWCKRTKIELDSIYSIKHVNWQKFVSQ